MGLDHGFERCKTFGGLKVVRSWHSEAIDALSCLFEASFEFSGLGAKNCLACRR